MATKFPEYIVVPGPIEIPSVRKDEEITHLIENNQHVSSPIHPMASVPDYAKFRQPIIAGGEEGSGAINPRGVSIEATTEYIHIADMSNSRIQIFSQTGDLIQHFGSAHLYKPWGILVSQDNIFITDIGNQAIFLFRIPDLIMIKRVGSKGAGNEEFNRPEQLDISPNQQIYVADHYNNRLQILTTDLKFKDTLKHRTMTNPSDVKFSNNEIFVLSYADNPCIHVFTLSGEKSRSILDSGIEQAWFFCMDNDNNIVISDYFGCSIKVFSSRGHLLYSIGERRKTRAVPFGVTIHNRRVIFACSNINYCLQIFS